MKDLPLKRGQLVTTFGPGSLVISPEGESAMIGALDKWFYDKNGNQVNAIDEFEIQEPRLKSMLRVSRLLMPPDYRPSYKFKGENSALTQTNTDIYIPLLRFPTWHYCPVCKNLYQLHMANRTSWMDCKTCKKNRRMIQVPFVMVCDQGHLSDFPWREWVHQEEEPTCEGQLSLKSTGGATLDSLKIECSCKKERSLRGIMTKRNDAINEEGISELSKRLNKSGSLYTCPGNKPWHGSSEEKESCDAYPIAVLKNSINTYYTNTVSAIYLPGENQAVERLINMFEINGVTSSLLDLVKNLDAKIEMVKRKCPPEIKKYSYSDIETAILFIEGGAEDKEKIYNSTTEQELRKKEFITLIDENESENLKVRQEWLLDKHEDDKIKNKFLLINRVTKLKETIVLTGFNRLNSEKQDSVKERIRKGKKLLFKDPDSPLNNWLPAYKVYGEGIFLKLDIEKILAWEKSSDVQKYFNRFLRVAEKKEDKIDESLLKPRSVLIHTLAHIIIDELALTCGYNSASIRERLYMNDDQSGILIYTSSGDIDGTFGGLVRMGKREKIFPVIDQAIEKAKWCSSDPVCTEIGKKSGQGINNLNGAACHNCCYLPETSCELRNLFLDRILLIDPKFGFFNT